MPWLLPGLNTLQKRQLFQALAERAVLADEERARYPMPEILAGSFAGLGWWVLMQELYDRPLKTIVGFLASMTYPLWWLAHALHRWF